MSRYLFAWELGGGLGHVMRMRPLALTLAERGHEVSVAVKNLSRAAPVFAGTSVRVLSAPAVAPQRGEAFAPVCTFAHLLHNTCFRDASQLRAVAQAWDVLLGETRADVVVCEHCPTLLLTARRRPVKRVVLGTGFCCPPDVSPLPDWRPELKCDPAGLLRDEAAVLETVNRWLREERLPELAKLTDLYTDADATVLATFPELDPFPSRTGAAYRGVWPGESGAPPEWPGGKGKRVFAYLKPTPHLSAILKALSASRLTTLVYAPGLPPPIQEQCRARTLRFAEQPVDLARAAAECDLAVLNATHGAVTAMLLAGKPMLLLPLFLEQALTARPVASLGAGLTADPRHPADVESKLNHLWLHNSHAQAAQHFAAGYRDFNPTQAVAHAVKQLAALGAG